MDQLRVTARVLPVGPDGPDGAVLLLEERDPADSGTHYWSSIGGAVEPGESLREAAVRELREESGIIAEVETLIGPVHRDEQAYSWNGVHHVADNSYFVLPLDQRVEVSFDGLEPEEVGNVFGAGWWTPASLAAHGSFRPPNLPEIISAALLAAALPGGDL